MAPIVIPGADVGGMPAACEKHFLQKRKRGHSEPVCEKHVMQAPGSVRRVRTDAPFH